LCEINISITEENDNITITTKQALQLRTLIISTSSVQFNSFSVQINKQTNLTNLAHLSITLGSLLEH